MDIGTALITLAGVAAIGIMSPGPDFMAVTHSAITLTRKQAALVALGVVLGNGIWAGAALFGVGALFTLFPTFFIAFKVCGGLYLIWLGIKMVRGAGDSIDTSNSDDSSGIVNGLYKGLGTTLANPKAAVYYASALTAIVPSGASYAFLASMVAVVVCVASIWFSFVVLFLSTKKASALYQHVKIFLESTFGSLVVIFGMKQIFSR